MKNSRKFALIALAIFTIIAFVMGHGPARNVSAQTTTGGVTMEVKLSGSGSDLALDIRLISKLKKPIRLYEWSLPWGNWRGMVLVAATPEPSGAVLDSPGPIDDPGSTVVTLSPGEEMKGRVYVHSHFPDLAQNLKYHDVVLFWSYQLEPIDGEPLERQGGWFLIPKVK